jgi:hypothetical protein
MVYKGGDIAGPISPKSPKKITKFPVPILPNVPISPSVTISPNLPISPKFF